MLSPCEAHAPLIVDADAPLPLPVAGKFFKPVAGRRTQEFQRLRRIQLRQLALGHKPNGAKASRALAFEQRLRIFAGKRLNHGRQDITQGVIRQA